MYKYKLKEIEVGDTVVRKGVKSTVTDIDPETGAIEWDVADVADFSSTYKALKKAKDFIDYLDKSAEKTKTDPRIDKFAIDLARLFNDFRSHVRKVYPEEYKRVLRLKEFYNTKVNEIKTTLEELNTKVTDKVTKIKIEEVIKMLPTLDKTSKVKDDDLTNLLQYYDLIEELKNVQV